MATEGREHLSAVGTTISWILDVSYPFDRHLRLSVLYPIMGQFVRIPG